MKSKSTISLLIIFFLIVKLNAQSLQYNWVNQIPGTHSVTSRAVANDSIGNIFISGIFGSAIGVTGSSIDIGSITLTATGRDKTYLAKLDNSGNVMWAKNIGTTPNCTGSGRIACTVLKGCVDNNGNFVTAGFFECPTLEIESATLINNSIIGFNSTDIYITKFDGFGNFVWAKNFGGVGNDSFDGLQSDSNGNIYLSFHFDEPVSIDGTLFTPVALYDILILKLASDGSVIWTKQISSLEDDDARGGIYVDENENVYVSGYSRGLDLNFGNLILTQNGPNGYFFIVKYDSSGNPIWVKNSDNSGGQPYPEDISGD